MSMLNTFQFQRQEQEQINSSLVDSYELLSLCFTLFDIDDENLKNEIQAQYLWKHSVPRAITLSKDVLESRSRNAFWFAYNAAALQTVPFNQNEQAASQIVAQKLIVSYDMMINRQSLLRIREQNYKPTQLAESAEKLFQSAKDIILDPLVYQQIPFNLTLVQALFLMATYLSTTGERHDEAKLLIATMQVYLSRERQVLKENLESNHLSENIRDAMVKQAQILMKMSGISTGFDFAMNIIRLNQIGIHKNTEKLIRKFLKKYISECDLQGIYTEVMAKSFKIKMEAGYRIVQLLKPAIHNATRLEQFMEETSLMHKGEYEQSERQFTTFWSFTLFQIQYAIAEATYQRCQDPLELHTVKDIRWRLANDITSYCYENRILCSFVCGCIQGVLHYMAEIHIEQSTELCSYGASLNQLESSLDNLKKDCSIYEEALAKMEIPNIRNVYNQLKNRVTMHEQYYQMARSGTDDIFILFKQKI
jgi:hypothetical protein